MKPGHKKGVKKPKRDPVVFRIIHGPAIVSFGWEDVVADSTKTNTQNGSVNNNSTQASVGL
jgi:hypothetical protein